MVELGLVRFLGPNRILHPFSFQLPGASEQKAPVEERVSARQLPAGRQGGQTVRWASVLCSWCPSVTAGVPYQLSSILCLLAGCGSWLLTVALAASWHQVVSAQYEAEDAVS